MKCAVIAFTRDGSRHASRIAGLMTAQGHECTAVCKGKDADGWGLPVVGEPLKEWTGREFVSNDALIFIGAAGIAVRAIAPYVAGKASDPAVLCMDEQAHFVISLLSGHLGGANELARKIAGFLGAVPVITTATDSVGRFSVDDFARRENMYLDSLKYAKEVAADILGQRTVGLYSDFEIAGSLPSGLSLQKKDGLGISISLDERYDPFPRTLHLVPRVVVLGVGCKKDTPKENIEALVREVMEMNQLSMHSILRVASVDLKKEEAGLIAFCRDLGVPFVTYTAGELSEVESETGFSESDFVRSVAGVGCVCERSALKAAGRKRLIQSKVAAAGVTVAVAAVEYKVDFEPQSAGRPADGGSVGGAV